MEFQQIFLPRLDQAGKQVHHKDKESRDAYLDQVRRQLFVAMTRARDGLWLAWAGQPSWLIPGPATWSNRRGPRSRRHDLPVRPARSSSNINPIKDGGVQIVNANGDQTDWPLHYLVQATADQLVKEVGEAAAFVGDRLFFLPDVYDANGRNLHRTTAVIFGKLF